MAELNFELVLFWRPGGASGEMQNFYPDDGPSNLKHFGPLCRLRTKPDENSGVDDGDELSPSPAWTLHMSLVAVDMNTLLRSDLPSPDCKLKYKM